MNDAIIDTTAAAVAVLRDAYPRQSFPDDSVRLYIRMLDDLDPNDVAEAVKRLIRRSTFLPSIAEIREDVAEYRCALPSAAEAWTIASQGLAMTGYHTMPDVVRESMGAAGGRWSIVHSERPTVVRAQFVADYETRRARAIRVAAGADPRPALNPSSPMATAARAVLDALPESESITPRPVWARWLRRQSGEPKWCYGQSTDGKFYSQHTGPPPVGVMMMPTDAEKADAIDVLRTYDPSTTGFIEPMHAEAQRIMDEATAA